LLQTGRLNISNTILLFGIIGRTIRWTAGWPPSGDAAGHASFSANAVLRSSGNALEFKSFADLGQVFAK
jgi:extradiol dioxygenase family protein